MTFVVFVYNNYDTNHILTEMKSIPIKFLPVLLVSFMLATISASAQQIYEVNCHDIRLSEVLKEVSSETGYSFVYSNTSVDVSQIGKHPKKYI